MSLLPQHSKKTSKNLAVTYIFFTFAAINNNNNSQIKLLLPIDRKITS